uniref:Succinate:cytochrome c oxidoreductase subunit 3 n=2 Tax=Gracilariopsis TaxID=2781 RepID=V9NEU8_9FLOR|nr:succinate:cytochrome c oxidoreductase subunit 3 [Gracilariopsis chorda]AEX37503.1 SdhC [Gracilariopsis lemaneiformis]AGO19242.1 succinate:cytochrome c oxidoreductase subunit 3 [Gracilariopsis chorda]
MYNRPLSPHITIYKPQASSLFSIWHRISGLFLTFLMVFFLISSQLLLFITNSKDILNGLIMQLEVSFVFQFIYIFNISIFFYHIINGFKHIIWDLGFFINQKFLFLFVLFTCFFIFLTILLLL